MVSEEQLIERVRRRFPPGLRETSSGSRRTGAGLRVGIGDDAAVLAQTPGSDWVITTDAFLENVHFLQKGYPPNDVGYKALARATSDLAAMGARPRYFFLTMALPEGTTGAWLDGLLSGMAQAARRFGLVLAGGDTSRYPTIVASLTVIGEVARGRAVLRSGAKPGDLLCVTGRLGEAALGLRIMQQRKHRRPLQWRHHLKKHLHPEPRLAIGSWLAEQGFASSMIDTSDGLSTDLRHICQASGVGAIVQAASLPVVRIPAELRPQDWNALNLALHGGEDYELLFTVPKKVAGRLPRDIGGVPITVIGEITKAKSILVADKGGRTKPLRAGGWDPFHQR
jgi:thiamine-monophosphate kinase